MVRNVAGHQCARRSEVFEDFLTLLQVFVVRDQSLFAPGLQAMQFFFDRRSRNFRFSLRRRRTAVRRQDGGEPCPVVDRESRSRGHDDALREVFLGQRGLVGARYEVDIHFSKWVKWSVPGCPKLSLRRRGSPGIRQQNNKLIAVDEQTSCGENGNAIRAVLTEEKDRYFVGLGFSQCGLEMRGEELGIVIGKSRRGLWSLSQYPVAEKADLRLDPHGSQDLSKIRGGQRRNVPSGRSRDFLLKQGTI